ncbi:hypothetical protein AB4373_13285, partial [Vibrio sp. 10N.261.51.C5]
LKSGSATVANGGAWSSSSVDISDQPNGSYTVIVTGTNASGVPVTESASFTLAQAMPTSTSATFNPTHQAIGAEAAVIESVFTLNNGVRSTAVIKPNLFHQTFELVSNKKFAA